MNKSEMDIVVNTSHLNLDRGYAKAKLTKKINEIRELMCNRKNSEVVDFKLDNELNVLHEQFINLHAVYNSSILDNKELLAHSQLYMDSATTNLVEFKQDVTQWLLRSKVHTPEHGAQNQVQTVTEVHKPRSDVSTTSRRSSIRGAKLEAAARRASLLAEVASMNLQRELEEEELVLKHQRRELDLTIQVAKAEAEEKVYSECGETDSSGSSSMGVFILWNKTRWTIQECDTRSLLMKDAKILMRVFCVKQIQI